MLVDFFQVASAYGWFHKTKRKEALRWWGNRENDCLLAHVYEVKNKAYNSYSICQVRIQPNSIVSLIRHDVLQSMILLF